MSKSLQVLEFRCVQRQQPAHFCLVCWIGILPVPIQELRPKWRQALVIGVAVLRDDSLYAFGMPGCQPESHGWTVVLNLNRILRDALLVEKVIDGIRELVERVRVWV